MRASLLVVLLATACGPVAVMTRPEGNGGWNAEERRSEIDRRAAAAGVSTESAPKADLPVDAPLGLGEALAMAAGGNRRIAEAEYMLGEAGARVRQVRGQLLPDVTGSGRYTWYTDSLTNQIALPPGVFPPGVSPVVEVREKESGRVNGTLTMPLDVTGQLYHALTAAQAGYRGEQARLWATTLAQQAAVVGAYFDLLQAEQLRVVTQGRIDVQSQQLDNAQQRFDAGRLTKNELLVVQVALRNSQQGLRQRDLRIAQARWALNQAIGRPVNAPTAVRDVTTPPELPTADDAMKDAIAHNPLLRALIEEQQRLEDTARSLERSRLPQFNAGGAIDYSTESILMPQRVGSGFVGFTWDLGTNGEREARIAETRIAADRNRVAVEGELRELENGVRTAQMQATERLAALSTAKTAVAQAEENLRIRQQQFDAGRATSEDVLDAEALLAEERASLATALYEAHTRRAELQQLMGLPLDALASATR